MIPRCPICQTAVSRWRVETAVDPDPSWSVLCRAGAWVHVEGEIVYMRGAALPETDRDIDRAAGNARGIFKRDRIKERKARKLPRDPVQLGFDF